MSRHRTRVKICGITCVQDALEAAHAGADAIGLLFWAGTPRRVSVSTARSIVAALPPFVSAVGLFVDPVEDEVRAVLRAVPLACLQFHGRERPAFCSAFGLPFVKAVPVAPGAAEADLLESARAYGDAAAWLFDAPARDGMPGGTGRRFDWSSLPANRDRPLVLSGGLDAGNVAAAIRAVRPWAVDVSSGVEVIGPDGRPTKGTKDAARIAAFIDEVRHADR